MCFPDGGCHGYSQLHGAFHSAGCGSHCAERGDHARALDVTVQKQILELIKELAMKFCMSLIMISHDLGVIAQTTQKVMIMYAGQVMEQGETSKVFKHMSHPYTQGLFAAIPKPGSSKLEGLSLKVKNVSALFPAVFLIQNQLSRVVFLHPGAGFQMISA